MKRRASASVETVGGQTWRARIGLLLPSSNICTEPDFYGMAPADVAFHATRMFIAEATPEALEQMTSDLDHAVRLLASAGVDQIVFACTSGSLLHGPGYDRKLAERIERLAGVPAVTTSTAVLDALHALGARSVAVGTPYLDEVNERVVRFLEGSGVKVSRIEGLQVRDGLELGLRPPDEVYRLGLRVGGAEADAIFLSCTNFRAAEVAEALEQATNKPVVTSNQATLWSTLRTAGISDSIAHFGRLLRS